MGKRKRNPERPATSTVGRARPVVLDSKPESHRYADDLVDLRLGDSLTIYSDWLSPTAIISDGGYGVLGFEGDTLGHSGLPAWYEPHVEAWAKMSTPATTLWFWNSEIGWAAVHPILEKHGWRYVNCNIWDKGIGHIAGNVNTTKIRRFPVVSEVCVQYVLEPRVNGQRLNDWLREEWRRSGLPFYRANEACGVKNAATRKYLTADHLWYFPPPEAFEQLAAFANKHGDSRGKPYYSRDGVRPMTAAEWATMQAKFDCPHGVTNIWHRPAVRGAERVKTPGGKAIHLNQKPLDLMRQIIVASTGEGDVVWEPFGGLFSACLAARSVGRRAFGAEIDSTYFQFGVERFKQVEMFAMSLTSATA